MYNNISRNHSGRQQFGGRGIEFHWNLPTESNKELPTDDGKGRIKFSDVLNGTIDHGFRTYIHLSCPKYNLGTNHSERPQFGGRGVKFHWNLPTESNKELPTGDGKGQVKFAIIASGLGTRRALFFRTDGICNFKFPTQALLAYDTTIVGWMFGASGQTGSKQHILPKCIYNPITAMWFSAMFAFQQNNTNTLISLINVTSR